MITHKNQLAVPEVSCYSREEIEGGTLVRYMVRSPGETAWRPVKIFRPDDPSQDATDGASCPPDA